MNSIFCYVFIQNGMIAHIKFPYKQHSIFSRLVIWSQPSMRIKSYSYCESKQIDCELGGLL